MRGTKEFAGTKRFEIISRLGAGGMGVVYEAIDRSNERHVALKTLKFQDGNSIYRFKREFRGLSDISHPNLVSLYELMKEGEQWFFTMELLPGSELLSYLRGAAATGADAPTHALGARPTGHLGSARSGKPWPPDDISRVRDVFRQLASGINALHLAGKLHRDIKPSNVLVSEEGRVVLVDFGLVSDVAGTERFSDEGVLGTVSYMSPEQACQKELTAASDWYALGAVLYEVLTGTLPFVGKAQSVLMEKQEHDGPDPRELLAQLPADLSQLCHRLMRNSPTKRPSGREVMKLLGATISSRGEFLKMESSRGEFFVGREQQLARLQKSLDRVRDNHQPGCVLVHGSPGIGKTALLKRFTAEAEEEEGAVVLAGRCYEREALPFKAIDTIVDALSRYLCSLPDKEVAELLPEYTRALSRLFPVLRTVPAVAARRRGQEISDPQEARRRGLAALRALLQSLAASRPVIIRVDDFQWGDSDSAVLLASLLGPPDPPNLLLCIGYRRDDLATSRPLQELQKRLSSAAVSALIDSLALERLTTDEVRKLAELRIGQWNAGDVARLVERVATESQGNPFFVEEMARYFHSNEAECPELLVSISLRETMLARLASLSDTQRNLLRVVAVAGAPITETIALEATGLHQSDASAVSVLRAGRLLRSNHAGSMARLESYHDRIRELIVDSTSAAQLVETYGRLARSIARETPEEHGTIADFYNRAGDKENASSHAANAARSATVALAFEKAAVYYKMALECPQEPDTPQGLRVRLAESLAYAGRGGEAAQAYLDAANASSKSEALDLHRMAAENLLRAGYVDRAIESFKIVLSTVGLSFAANSRRSLGRLLLGRTSLRLRGLRFKEKDTSQIAPQTLLKIDVCGSCGLGFGMNDPICGAEFQTRQLLLALRAGEPVRIARAMVMEAMYRGAEGHKGRRAAERLLRQAKEVGDGKSPELAAFATTAQALVHFECGEWRAAATRFDEAAVLYLRKCRGHQFVAVQVERLAVDALFMMGEIGEVAKRVPEILRDAEDRGDMHGVTDMQTGLPNTSWLVRGNVAQAKKECEIGAKQWSERSFYLQHYTATLSQVLLDLYQGEGPIALARVEKMWPLLKRSMLLRVPFVAAQGRFLYGRALLAAAAQSDKDERVALLARVNKQAKRLSTMLIKNAVPFSLLLNAQVHLLRDQKTKAALGFRQAYEAFEVAEMKLCKFATADALGELVAGDEGRCMREQAQAWADTQKIHDPQCFYRMVLPVSRAGEKRRLTSGRSD